LQGFIFAISLGKYEKRAKEVVKKGEDFYSWVFNFAIFYNREKREIKVPQN